MRGGRCGPGLATAAVAALLAASSVGRSAGEGRTAEQILAEIDAIRYETSLSLGPLEGRRERIEAFKAQVAEGVARRDPLVDELFRVAPNHARIPELMLTRWGIRADDPGRRAGLPDEIDRVLFRNDDPRFRLSGIYWKARALIDMDPLHADDAIPTINLLIRLAPEDRRGLELLDRLASRMPVAVKREAVEDRIIRDFPASAEAILRKGARRRREGIGKPFELEFTDAIQGQTVSMKGLKGKVVVIDFWATWCGPCVAEMPRMKSLYEAYREKGVEFIGVNSDARVEDLRAFVAEKGIAWPQYHQGRDGGPRFSDAWGVESIPAVFLIAQDGTLFSDKAAGQLDRMIPKLLEKGPPARAEASRPAAPAAGPSRSARRTR